jgi:hypothetical protein
MSEEQTKRLAKILGLAETAGPEEIITAATALGYLNTELRTILGDEPNPLLKVRELQTSATAAKGAQARITELETKVSTFEAREQEGAALELVKTYQQQRKVGADDSDNFKACFQHAKSDPDGFKALMESMQPWVAGGQQARPNPDEQASNELSADQREMARVRRPDNQLPRWGALAGG